MSNLIGQSLGRYHILEQLGEGGMAIVYKAFDTRLERDVAVKVIRTEKLTIETMDKTLKRFEREAKALAKLTHPNIVPITDYGEHEGKPYLVMAYLPGGTLKIRLKGQPIPWKEAAHILTPIAHALEHAHQQSIIHRDVKPSNILITRDGQPMLSDFGVAKVLEADETVDLTGTGVGIGTPDYMAPEQGFGHSIDARVDVYALGVVFYEMVTGRRPYQADTPMAIMLKKNTEPLPRPTAFVPSLPRAVENHLIKALARDPSNRFQTMGEMAASLEDFAAGKLTAVKPQEEEKAITIQTAWMRNKLLWLGSGLIGLLCLVALVTGGIFARQWLGIGNELAPTQTEKLLNPTLPVLIETLPPTRIPTISIPSTSTIEIIQQTRQTASEGIKYYYQIISAGNYQKAWGLLTINFIKKNNSSGYQPYADWWSTVEKVVVDLVTVDYETEFEAHLIAELSYYYTNGQVDTYDLMEFFMIYSESTNIWMIDDAALIRGTR